MTAEDRRKIDLVKTHFKSWDRRELGVRTRSGTGGHAPDDIAMAAWVGFVKALALLQRSSGGRAKQAMPVPRKVQEKFDRMAERSRERKYVNKRERHEQPNMRELLNLVIGSDGGE